MLMVFQESDGLDTWEKARKMDRLSRRRRRVCLGIGAVLLLCELGRVAAASEKLSAREAAMAGSHTDAMPRAEGLHAEAAEAASTDSEESEGGEEGNAGEGSEDATEEEALESESPTENLGDDADDADDSNDGGLPPMEEEHAYFASLDTSRGEGLPASVCCGVLLCVSADYAAAATPPAILFYRLRRRHKQI